jgi:TatD DNase family protein
VTLIDIGANLGNKAFAADLPEVLARSAEAGVGAIVITGTSAEASTRARTIAGSHDGPRVRLFSTAGVHPHHASAWSGEVETHVRGLLADPRVVAVGECGLDYDRDFSPRDAQRRAFEAQLALAAGTKKPLFLHERAAHDDFHAIVKDHRASLAGGVVHCFTGDRAALEAYLALDLHIGLTGWICDERRGRHLEALAPVVPRGRLMLETDAPYILPRDLRPRPRSGRNEPGYLRHVAEVVARHRSESLDDLAAHTTETARRFFALPHE